jgi:hypothetical protein
MPVAEVQNDSNSRQTKTEPPWWSLFITMAIMFWADFLFVSALRGSSAESLGVYTVLFMIIAPVLAIGVLRINFAPSKASIVAVAFITLLATLAKYMLYSIVQNAG